MGGPAAADTICALATPAGTGGVGLVRLSGPTALDLLRRATGRSRFTPRRLHLARLRDPSSTQVIDQVLVACMPAPRSYTGEDVVEISGHGGPLNMQQIVDLFLGLGARHAEPGEFTRRAFLNGRLDLTQVEAVAELIGARSERALRNARALLDGELGRRVRQVCAGVIELVADLEACIDFADELEAPVSPERLAEAHRELVAGIERLAATYEQGRRLGGIAVAFSGPVNAGKSSLFNALLGGRRALVSESPGTTRDYLEAEVSWRGQRVTLVDTAGRRPADRMTALERAGHEIGSERLGRCDLVIHVVDLSGERAPGDLEGARLVAANKCDLVEPGEVERRVAAIGQACGAPVLPVSALHGQGLEGLRRAAIEAVFPGSPGGEQPSEGQETVQITQERQREALVRAARALGGGLDACNEGLAPELVVEHAREALGALGEITGERHTERVLDSIFSRFCIGK